MTRGTPLWRSCVFTLDRVWLPLKWRKNFGYANFLFILQNNHTNEKAIIAATDSSVIR